MFQKFLKMEHLDRNIRNNFKVIENSSVSNHVSET